MFGARCTARRFAFGANKFSWIDRLKMTLKAILQNIWGIDEESASKFDHKSTDI